LSNFLAKRKPKSYRKEVKETPFLPKVVQKVSKKKQASLSKPRKPHNKPKLKDFEPFKLKTAYGHFMNYQGQKGKSIYHYF